MNAGQTQLCDNFTAIIGEFDINHPIICKITKIMEYRPETDFIIVMLEDPQNHQAIGFFYENSAKILNSNKIRNRIPLWITMLKGNCKVTGQNKRVFEVRFAIFESLMYINSNLLGSHAYCEMETYLRAYINTASEKNQNLIFGTIFHDFLALLYSSPEIYNIKRPTPQLHNFLMGLFQKALYSNWELITLSESSMEDLLEEFRMNYLANERDFLLQELAKYREIFGEFEFICEKMIYSRYLGIQGKIDRLVRNKNFTRFNIYETKTGTSSHSSTMFAYYQGLAYATMLKEYYPEQIDAIIIEYPRNTLNDRLKIQSFDEIELRKLLQMRNEIWAITIGIHKEMGPFHGCGKCFSRSACSFYCYRAYRTKYCAQHLEKCTFFQEFEQDIAHRNLFNRIDAYFSWFFYLLDQEFLANLTIISDTHLPVTEREKKGDCIGDLIIDKEHSKFSEKEINFLVLCKQSGENFTANRMRKGDYVLITPQKYIPLTSESQTGTIQEITENQIIVSFNSSVERTHEILTAPAIRVDLTSSNYMINLNKKALDILIRGSVTNKEQSLEKLRNLLIFQQQPRLKKEDHEDMTFSADSTFDASQQAAIRTAMQIADLQLIQGPPGTGKTTVIAEIVIRLVQRYHSYAQKPIVRPVLITAYTNKAVDTLIEKIINRAPKIKIVRIGNTSMVDSPIILSRTIDRICQSEITLISGEKITVIDPLKVKLVLQNADVIAATTTSAGNTLLEEKMFETVILDEAGQIIEPSALVSLAKGQKWIIVGDHMQLPPIMTGIVKEIPEKCKEFKEKLHFKEDYGLSLSIFERLSIEYSSTQIFSLLSYQYRMNAIISGFISHEFYHGQLQPGTINGRSVGEQTLLEYFKGKGITQFDFTQNHPVGKFFDPDQPLVFLDTELISAFDSSNEQNSSEMESIYNSTEAEIVIALVHYYVQQIMQHSLDKLQFYDLLNQIGIISGYRAQNQRIRNQLGQILIENQLKAAFPWFKPEDREDIIGQIRVDTVDRFQGGEREIIIYSFVDSNASKRLRPLNCDIRRLNVAISRGKKKVFVIGNSRTLCEFSADDTTITGAAKNLHSRLKSYILSHNGYYRLTEIPR
jgi:DNA polymerase III delta prime subunit